MTGQFVPSAVNTYDFGDDIYYWAKLWAQRLSLKCSTNSGYIAARHLNEDELVYVSLGARGEHLFYVNNIETMRLAYNTHIMLGGIYDFTTSSAANLYINAGGWLYRSTCGECYKHDIRPLEVDTAGVLLLDVCTYEVEEGVDQGKDNMPIQQDVTHHTLIGNANMQENYPAAINDLTKDGCVDSIDWNAVTSALLVELRKARADIDSGVMERAALTERVQSLEDSERVMLDTVADQASMLESLSDKVRILSGLLGV